MSIKEITESFPEYAKDLKLNYSKILNENILEEEQLYSLILVSALTIGSGAFIKSAHNESKNFLSNEFIEAVYIAHSIMSMNATYYRFLHLTKFQEYSSMPANLRMLNFNKHKIKKSV